MHALPAQRSTQAVFHRPISWRSCWVSPSTPPMPCMSALLLTCAVHYTLQAEPAIALCSPYPLHLTCDVP